MNSADTSSENEQGETKVTGLPNPALKYDPLIYEAEKNLGIRKDTGAKQLKKLGPSHKRIIELHLRGHTHTEICQALGETYSKVQFTLNDPLAKEVINSHDDLTAMEFQALRRKVNAALRDGLDHKDINVRLRAAQAHSKRDIELKKVEQGVGDITAEDVAQKIINEINISFNFHDPLEKRKETAVQAPSDSKTIVPELSELEDLSNE